MINVKRDFEILWKDTFKDSEEYVRMLFDGYGNKSIIEYIEQDGKLVSAMLGLPHRFVLNANTSDILDRRVDLDVSGHCSVLYGLYLCGLSTHPAYRCQGLMGNLIKRIEQRASELGYDFIFLIPADSHLQDYYKKFGFEDAFPRWKGSLEMTATLNNLSGESDIRFNQFLRIEYFGDIESLLGNIEISENHKISRFCNEFDNLESIVQPDAVYRILRSEDEMLVVIKECFISGGGMYIARDENTTLVGIAFIYKHEGIITVYKLSAKNYYVRNSLLKRIRNDFYDKKIKIFDRSEFTDIHGEKFNAGMLKMIREGLTVSKIERIKNAELSLMLD